MRTYNCPPDPDMYAELLDDLKRAHGELSIIVVTPIGEQVIGQYIGSYPDPDRDLEMTLSIAVAYRDELRKVPCYEVAQVSVEPAGNP